MNTLLGKLKLKEPPTRLRLLMMLAAVSGIAALAASPWPGETPSGDLVEAVVRDRPERRSGPSDPVVAPKATDLTPPDRGEVNTDAAGNPFKSNSWAPPPPSKVVAVTVAPVVAAPTEPPKPVAPPLPYAFVGKLEAKNAKPRAFLSKGEALVIVSPGDVLDNNTYRVESMDQTSIVLNYLPLNQRQVINISGGK